MAKDKTRQLTALIELSALITSLLETREITKQAIESANKLVGTEACSLLLLDRETRELFFEVAVGEKSEIPGEIRLPRGEGIAGWVAEHGVAQLVRDVAGDPRFYGQVDAASGFVTREIACVPVRFQDKMFGVMEAMNKIDGRLTEDDLEILQALANHVAVALENARLYSENSRQYERLLTRERAHQREKEKLLRDLHDGIGGLTTNINLLSELGRKSRSVDDMGEMFSTIAELSREGMGEIRSFMNSLEDREATWSDLAAEFRRYGNSMLESHTITFSIATTVECPDDLPGLFLYLSIFRIYKEALANVVKHARARGVRVTFTVGPARLFLEIHDDGAGMPPVIKAGRGIANMRTRAAELGGMLRIDGQDGTRIGLEVPLPFSSDYPLADKPS